MRYSWRYRLDRGSSPGNATGLLTGLVAYWTLDEAAGDPRVDSHAGQDLSLNGTVGSIAGALNNAAQNGTGAATNFLSRASEAALETGDISFAFSCWLNPVAFSTGIRGIAGKGTGLALEWALQAAVTTGILTFTVWDAGQVLTDTILSAGGIPTGAWSHVVVQRNKTAGQLELWIGGVAETPVAFSGLVSPAAGAEDFRVLRAAAIGLGLRGAMDEAGFWKFSSGEELDQAKVDLLYNSGTPLPYGSF